MTIEANFQMLTESIENSDTFAKLFGIANISDYSQASAQYPHSATQITKALGGTGSWLAVSAIKKIKTIKGVDIQACDNRYHRSEKINTTTFHKYSADGLELLSKVHNGEEYEVNMD